MLAIDRRAAQLQYPRSQRLIWIEIELLRGVVAHIARGRAACLHPVRAHNAPRQLFFHQQVLAERSNPSVSMPVAYELSNPASSRLKTLKRNGTRRRDLLRSRPSATGTAQPPHEPSFAQGIRRDRSATSGFEWELKSPPSGGSKVRTAGSCATRCGFTLQYPRPLSKDDQTAANTVQKYGYVLTPH